MPSVSKFCLSGMKQNHCSSEALSWSQAIAVLGQQLRKLPQREFMAARNQIRWRILLVQEKCLRWPNQERDNTGSLLTRPLCSPYLHLTSVWAWLWVVRPVPRWIRKWWMVPLWWIDQSVLQRSKQVICLVWNKDSVFTHQKGRNHVFLSLHWYYSTTSW